MALCPPVTGQNTPAVVSPAALATSKMSGVSLERARSNQHQGCCAAPTVSSSLLMTPCRSG